MNNNNSQNVDRQQTPVPGGHPSLPPQYQHALQQQQQQHSQFHPQTQDPQLAYALAAAASRGGHPGGTNPGPMGAGNNNNSAGFGSPGHFGNGSMPSGLPQAQSAAAQLYEEQILQRASALRAEALMSQQQGQQQQAQSSYNPQQLQMQAALQHLQQMNGPGAVPASAAIGNPSPSLDATDPRQQLLQKQQEAALARAAVLRDLGLAGPSGGAALGAPGLDRYDLNSLMRARQQQQQSQQQHSAYSSVEKELALEQELERVRQAQRVAGMSTSSNQPMGASGANVADAVALANERIAREGSATAAQPTKSQVETSQNDVGTAAAPQGKPKIGIPELLQTPKDGAVAGAAAAAAVRCKTKDELRKNPGTVIVPCRARGMPMDHNFISAYFVISEDAKHGENLICSYYACRNGGIKFRYCAYCMAPVAKRNFSRRHDHGMSKNKDTSKAKDDDAEKDDNTLDKSDNTGSDKASLSSTTKPPAVASSLKRTTKQAPIEEKPIEKVKKRQKVEITKPRAKTTPVKETKVKEKIVKKTVVKENGGEDLSAKRLAMWNDLLIKRPRSKDPKDLSSWLNEVLAVSDINFPLEQVSGNLDQPYGKLLFNALPKLSKLTAEPADDERKNSSGLDTAAKDDNNKSTSHSKGADNVVGNNTSSTDSAKNSEETKIAVTAEAEQSSEIQNCAKKDASITKALETNGPESDSENKSTELSGNNNNEEKEGDGFSGSFADWRDRKKSKLIKKGSGSLRK